MSRVHAMETIRVRFAPSPTGFLHVGGARTALFNWLFVRNRGGRFILRIEDTDRARSSQEMVAEILDGLKWLGIAWDEGPFFQSHRKEEHRADGLRMEAQGKAYSCFCPPVALKERRQKAERERRAWKYDRRCLELSAEDVKQRRERGDPNCLRFRVPAGSTTFHDLVHGETRFDNAAIEDFVLLRSDGSPTYQLSVVSDDTFMRITHVIRGDDHLSNTPKQILLYQAMGIAVPVFAHLPLIHGGDGKRLSKRHGAVSVTDYRREGYLPEALFNFLALLGWSPGTTEEILDPERLTAAFSFEEVSAKSAIFDVRKLEWMNSQYINQIPVDSLLPMVKEELARERLWREDLLGERKPWFLKLIETLRDRSKLLGDFARDGRPFLTDRFEYEEKAIRKHLKGEDLAARMKDLRDRFGQLKVFDEESAEQALRGLAEKAGASAASLIHPLRVALTGRAVSPGIFRVADLIGKERVLARITRLVEFLESAADTEP